ncbi:MAG: VTT domain-containing protein [Micromonosporaceae bacterium]|nr:VTT domain-containing protein [Micromonosporaceae bacterium]
MPVDTAAKYRALAGGLGSLLNPKDLLQNFGLLGVWAILFAETGLLIGFFFPGDSLLFLAGVAASSAAQQLVGVHLNMAGLLIGCPIAAIAGAQLGHFLGARYGRRMFERPNSRLFNREHVVRAEYYFNRFGPAKAILLARFTPIIRTFLNPMAGVLEVPAGTFFIWNVIGGVVWTDGVLLAGYYLADKIKNVIPPDKIDVYLLPFIALIVLISLIPIFIEIIRARRAKRGAGRHAVSRDERG